MITIKVEIEDDGKYTCFNIMGEKDNDKEPTDHETFFAYVAKEKLKEASRILDEVSDACSEKETAKILKKYNIKY